LWPLFSYHLLPPLCQNNLPICASRKILDPPLESLTRPILACKENGGQAVHAQGRTHRRALHIGWTAKMCQSATPMARRVNKCPPPYCAGHVRPSSAAPATIQNTAAASEHAQLAADKERGGASRWVVEVGHPWPSCVLPMRVSGQ
jgi:hypothetical protein